MDKVIIHYTQITKAELHTRELSMQTTILLLIIITTTAMAIIIIIMKTYIYFKSNNQYISIRSNITVKLKHANRQSNEMAQSHNRLYENSMNINNHAIF